MISKRNRIFLATIPLAIFLIVFGELQHTRWSQGSRLTDSILTQSLLNFVPVDQDLSWQTVNRSLPPLESIIDDDDTIIGSPQVLLDFAIIGMGKCGTSTLMHWLADHPELQCLRSEVWALPGKDPGRLIRRLHKNLKHPYRQRGYKCPGDLLENYSMDYYRQYWPKTKLFIGLRHPVEWFQSLYNFRVQNFLDFDDMLHPNELIGLCWKESKMICTRRGHFALHLLQLGKHHYNGVREFTDLENEISDLYQKDRVEPENITYLPNDIFLFELNQLGDKNTDRKDQLRHDIQTYLGLKLPLPEVIHFTPGREWNETFQAAKDRHKIRICDDEFIPVRRRLVEQGRLASEWIRSTFLDLPGVYYSSREYLEVLLETWMEDPCGPASMEASEERLEYIMMATNPRYNETKLKKEAREKQRVKFYAEKQLPMGHLPPYETVVDEYLNITGDVSSVLDFSIIGFGKCGTSTLMHWLGAHPETQTIPVELYFLIQQEPGKLVKTLYTRLAPGGYKRGYKCPGEIQQKYVLNYYRQYFPRTKIFIGMRHPILWFQSLYNFRVQNLNEWADMRHPNRLIGPCFAESKKICTKKGHFAHALLTLGKTNWNGTRPFTELEEQIATWHKREEFEPEDAPYMPNDIFLFDLTQLADQNATRKATFRRDVQNFLGLHAELPEVLHVTPGKEWTPELQAAKDKKKIDICEDQYIPVRRELMRLSRMASQWIRETFLDLPGVYVSSREHFEAIMLDWARDPCGDKSDLISEEESEAIRQETTAQYKKAE